MKTVIHLGNADPKAVDLYSSLSTAYVLLWGPLLIFWTSIKSTAALEAISPFLTSCQGCAVY